MTTTGGWCIHGVPYKPNWTCPQCTASPARAVCYYCGWPSGMHATTCSTLQVSFGKWAALESAEAENDRLRTKLDAAEKETDMTTYTDAEAEAEAARLREQLKAADDRLAECEERVDRLRNLRGQLDAANARLAEREEEIAQLRRTLIDTIRADRERELEAMRTAELMSPSTFRARLAALRELSNEADELGDYTS